MKKFLLALALMVPMFAWGQDTIRRVQPITTMPISTISTEKPKQRKITRDNISFSDYDISFSGVEKCDWLLAKDLYNAALTWLADFYEHPKDVIRVNTPEKIIIEGRTGIHITDDSDINCIITFEFKEGLYRWSINDCILIDNFMRMLGRSDKRIRTIPRYNKESATDMLIYDFSPFIESFRKKIRAYRPNVTPIPEGLSSDW